ncbi:MAG: glycosyltransferase family 4 protein [Ignavibacteriaceae bacterium]
MKPKKILHISPDFNYSCGVSKYVYSLLKGFSGDKSYEIYFITNGGDALDKLKEINITPKILHFSRGAKNVFNIYPNLKVLRDFCVEKEIDIIHTHHRYPEFLAYLISKKIKVKTITTVHSLVKGKNKFSFKSDKIIAVSNAVKSMLSNYYKVPDEKIAMMYNCIEPLDSSGQQPNLNTKTNLGIPSSGKIILFIGRITKTKGVDILIEAFKILSRKNQNLYLLIIGSFYDNRLKKSFKNLPNEIKLLDAVKNPYPYYSIADLVVSPSRIESLSYVMLESGLMHKPFIGAKTGGISEFIDDNINGLLVEPGNVELLVDKMNYLIEYPEKGKILAENLFNKVKENTSCERYFDKLDQIYEGLLLEK